MNDQQRVPVALLRLGQDRQAAVTLAIHVPEVNAHALQLAGIGTLDAQMGIAPLCGVTRADVKAPDKSGLSIHDQHLAVVANIPAQRKWLAEPGEKWIAQDVHIGRKAFEMARHHQVREAIIHHIDRNPAIGGLLKLHLKLLPHDIVFPDKGLEEDALASLADRQEHRLVEILAVGIDLHARGTNLDRRGGCARKAPLGTIAFAPGVDGKQNSYYNYLQTK